METLNQNPPSSLLRLGPSRGRDLQYAAGCPFSKGSCPSLNTRDLTATPNGLHRKELVACNARAPRQDILLGLPIRPTFDQNWSRGVKTTPTLEKPDKFDAIAKIDPERNDLSGGNHAESQGFFCNLHCFSADASSIFKPRHQSGKPKHGRRRTQKLMRKIYEKLSKASPELGNFISNKPYNFQRQIHANLELLAQRVEDDPEVAEYKRSGFSYYSKVLLQEMEELLRTSMPSESTVETKTLAAICSALRLNELELLQWHLFVYRFVKEDIIFSRYGQKLQFERCDEMVIASAVFAKALSNQSDDGQSWRDSAPQFDEDSQRLIAHLSLDESRLLMLFGAAMELSGENS